MYTRPKILTWHIHGSYLYYLSFASCEFYIPVKEGRPPRFVGLPEGNFSWKGNMHEIKEDEVKSLDFDLILFQSKENYLTDQFEILTPAQRKLPKIYLEHDPPRETPTDTKHIVDDSSVFLVHVTHFNNLMWDCGKTPTTVIEHGVSTKKADYTGELEKGIVMVNNIKLRGRRLGFDIFEEVRREIPLDIIGMGSKEIGGLGEIPHHDLAAFLSKYRFFFNPIRYTSLGLSVCEAMMTGLPVVGLSTTEMPRVIENGASGFLDNDLGSLIGKMKLLLSSQSLAQKMGNNAQKSANKNFSIERFAKNWEEVFESRLNNSSSYSFFTPS